MSDDREEAFQTFGEELVSRNPYWEHRRDRYALPGDSTPRVYDYVWTRGSVLILPRLADGRLALVRQLRYLGRRPCLEFPGGGVPEGMTPLDAARLELREETGFTAGAWRRLGAFNPCKGIVAETCTVFLAEDLTDGEPDPEDSEVLTRVLMERGELRAAIQRGELWDGMSLAALALLEL